MMNNINGGRPFVARHRPLHIGVPEEVEEHQPRRNAIQRVKQVRVGEAVRILVELLRPIEALTYTEIAHRLTQRELNSLDALVRRRSARRRVQLVEVSLGLYE